MPDAGLRGWRGFGMARKKRSQTTCTCTAYPFPHRDCGGGCAYGDLPANLREHDRGRGLFGEDSKRPDCVKRRKAHKTAGKHGAARAQAAARRRARAMVG